MSKIEIREVKFSNIINNDSGSGAAADLVTWKPDFDAGFYYLGPSASNSTSDIPQGIIVRELKPGSLIDIAGWRQVWNDAGSGKRTDYALWQAVSPSPDYIALASFFTRSKSPPDLSMAIGIKCIHRDLLCPASPNREVWTDRSSGAISDGAVWLLDANDPSVIVTGAFVAVRGYKTPPGFAYGLKREHILKDSTSLVVTGRLDPIAVPTA